MSFYRYVFSLGLIGFPIMMVQPSLVLKDPKLLDLPISNIIIMLERPTDVILAELCSRKNGTDADHRNALIAALGEAIKPAQTVVIELLVEVGAEFEAFWIIPGIAVKGVTPLLIQLLQGLQDDHVIGEIVEDIKWKGIIHPSSSSSPGFTNGIQWGLKVIGAPDVWPESMGEGVQVAIIDSGVVSTHVDFTDRYVGDKENGWFDAVDRRNLHPVDPDGHGTHCLGTILGANGFGVAPKAKWRACRCLDDKGEQTISDTIKCGEWVVCPTNAKGKNRDCSKTPQIVSNSWGDPYSVLKDDFKYFNNVIQVWNCAGIIGVFAAGNDGPTCTSLISPGDQPGIISVGSVTGYPNNDIINPDVKREDLVLSKFSSRGPLKNPDGRVVPLLLAPGEWIYSSSHAGDNEHELLRGTSMACPHVSGSIALLLSANPYLKREEIENLLTNTAFQGLKPSVEDTCGVNPEGVYPNDMQGYGLIDIKNAYFTMFPKH